MKGCRKFRGLVVEALFENLDPGAKPFFEEHLHSCPDCAAEFQSLRDTVETVGRRVRRDPGREFWDGYWDRLSRRLETGGKTAVRGTSDPAAKRFGRFALWNPRWAFSAAAAVVLVAIGIMVGRAVFPPRPLPVAAGRPAAETQPGQDPATDPVLRARIYVDKSKLVLLALVNYVPSGAGPQVLDLSLEKQVSRELVRQAGGLKSDLQGPGRRRLRELVTDLETVLLQISNLESRDDLAAVEFVKQGVESRGIFLKINLSEMGGDLSPSGREPAPEKPPTRKIKT